MREYQIKAPDALRMSEVHAGETRLYSIRYKGTGGVYDLSLDITVAKKLRFSCTCQAANKGWQCKHRIAIIRGDYSKVFAVVQREAAKLNNLLNNSKIAEAFRLWEKAVDDTDRHKKAFIAALRGV
jgi:uncharacterized Zn finger protein